MHTGLYIEFPEELHAADKDKSLRPEHRNYLIDLFSRNRVDSVFSGHVHFENFLEEHRGIRQYILTSINHQNEWKSKETNKQYGPDNHSYYRVDIQDGMLPQVYPILV